MQNVIKNLVAIVGLSLLGIGMVNAAPLIDCGDDDAQPITVHSAANATNKES